MTTSSLTFRLPRLDDTFSVFPHNGINPHFSECCRQSREWVDKYLKTAFGPKMRTFLSNCNLELIAAYTHPNADPNGLRAVMDYVCFSLLHIWGHQLTRHHSHQLNIAWTFDEFTDDLAGEEAAQAAAVVCRTLRDPSYDDGSWICQMIAEYVPHFLIVYEMPN